jgi:hypothetical protein
MIQHSTASTPKYKIRYSSKKSNGDLSTIDVRGIPLEKVRGIIEKECHVVTAFLNSADRYTNDDVESARRELEIIQSKLEFEGNIKLKETPHGLSISVARDKVQDPPPLPSAIF